MRVVERENSTLTDWIEAHAIASDPHFGGDGALLLRGFDINSIERLQEVATPLCGDIFTENSEHTPVSADGAVQTPVPFSADRMLLWHNENAFNDEWPLRIAFCCAQPAASGGETPIVDSRVVLDAMEPSLRERFEQRGVAYIRNYGSGAGLPWQTVFRTDDRAEVTRYCQAHHIEAEWSASGRLRTTASRPAVIAHPITGEQSFFAQPQHWHPACLDEDVRATLAPRAARVGFPRDCTFGDGSPIDDEEMRHLLEVYRAHQIVFPWQSGDLLVLDNVLWAHGRNPYQGRRVLLVVMGTMYAFALEPAS